jgi:predicted chitinase
VASGARETATSEAAPVVADERRGAVAAPLSARLLGLQRSIGNAAVGRVLARYTGDEDLLKPASTKGGSRKGRVDVPITTVYDQPGGTAIGTLDEGTPVRVLSTDGDAWTIEYQGRAAYVDWMDIEISDATRAVTLDQLFKVYPGLAADAAADPGVMAKAQKYLEYMNEAFDLFGFDTLESQAAFLAHGWAESDQFRRFTEATLGQKRYIEDPTTVKLDTKYLEETYKPGTKNRGSINPTGPTAGTGDWRYIGRGATQVTHSYNYKRACDIMELQAGLIEQANAAGAARLREAAAAIRKDAREAARPMYTFLFSAAVGKAFNLDRPREAPKGKIRNRAYNAGAVTGGFTDPQASGKQKAFERALDNL